MSSSRDRITGVHPPKSKSTTKSSTSSNSSQRTVTPTSSIEDERNATSMSSAPARTTSGSRFSTKSSKKPWLDRSSEYNSDDGSSSDVNKKSLRRTASGDEHVLHAPKLSPTEQRKGRGGNRRITMPTNPDEDESESNHMDADLAPNQAFDDLWDESSRAPAPTTDESPKKSKFDMLAKKSPTPPKRTQQQQDEEERIETTPTPAEHQQQPQRKQTPSETTKEIDTSRFIKKGSKDIDTSKFIKKGSRAPPNTPTDAVHEATAGADESGDDQSKRGNPIRHRRKSTSSSSSRPTRSRSTSSRSSTSSKRRPSRIKQADGVDIGSSKREEDNAAAKTATEYKDKDEAISSLEKQLDRVTFLQKRQFDQLSSLKKMLLSSRAKEKEHVKTKEEIQKELESRDSKIASLEQQLEQSQYLRKQAQSATSMMAASHSNLQFSVGDADAGGSKKQTLRILELEQQIQEMERRHEQDMKTKEADMATQLEEREAKIAQLEQRLESMEATQKEAAGQTENALAIAQNKLIKKVEHAATLHEEIEEMREQLTAAHSTIEQLEEERNYSRAKMAELNDMISSKGGLSNTEKELLERAAEISNLTSKLSAIDAKVQERDNKIFKMEEEIKGINDLVQQLSDGFVGDDEERKNQQRLLLESSTSPGQTSSLLLMTMMNMLDALKSKMEVLQKERDDMNAKASDRGIQLAESHIRVDKLRTELRRMRSERERARTNPNDPRRAPPPGARPQTAGRGAPRPAGANGRAQPDRLAQSQNRGNSSSGNLKDQMYQSSERSTSTAPAVSTTPPQKPSRFMNFLKGSLTSEVGPEPSRSKSPGATRPLTVQT